MLLDGIVVKYPFHAAIVRALGELDGVLEPSNEDNTDGLKALLLMVGLSAIPKDHGVIRVAVRKAMIANAGEDEELFELYEEVSQHLHSEQTEAEKLAAEKQQETAARQTLAEEKAQFATDLAKLKQDQGSLAERE